MATFGQAIADYSKAIEINPRFVAAYNSRAEAFVAKGDYERAVADVTKAGELGSQKERAGQSQGCQGASTGQAEDVELGVREREREEGGDQVQPVCRRCKPAVIFTPLKAGGPQLISIGAVLRAQTG